jgi:cellulose synthase/poly-beta-1,6-N-acetylglucosamine synthase-like glycosyltransferase
MMAGWLGLVLVAAGLVLALPVAVIFLQVLLALPQRLPSRAPREERARVAVIVPAYNEELVIAKTLASVSRQLEPNDRVVVVADNCSDHTAEIARQHGAEVTIRSNSALRGKGYALDHALQFIRQSGAPEVVIFIDADCQLDDGCIDRLVRSVTRSQRPAQAAYLMNPPQPPRPMTAIVTFAWRVKDFVRPLGWHCLGLPCQLAGSGMAFPWQIAQAVEIAGGELAEDLKLGLDLALAGIFAEFCPEAVVTSSVTASGMPTEAQRARWEHGSIETTIRYFPRLLVRFWRVPSVSLLALALDLSVPPLALLALALGAHLTLTLLLYFIAGASTPLVISIVICAVFFAAILLAWRRYGREILPLHWLVFAPAYAIIKLPLYVRFFLARQREWVRGERDLRG